MKNYLTVDVGGSSIKYGIINDNYELSHKGQIGVTREGIDAFVKNILSILDKVDVDIDGISISLAGTLNRKTGDIINGATYSFLEGHNMQDIFRPYIDKPVSVVNDAVAAALAEVKYGVLQNCTHSITIVLGTGVGCCIIDDNHIIEGKHFYSGQVSLIKTDSLDTGFGHTLGYFNGKSGLLKEVQKELNTDQELNGYEIFEMANNGNEKVLKALSTFCRHLAIQLYNLQVIFDCEIIAIGGGISAQPLLIQMIDQEMQEMFDMQGAFHFPCIKPQIIACKHNNDSNLIGAFVHFKSLF